MAVGSGGARLATGARDTRLATRAGDAQLATGALDGGRRRGLATGGRDTRERRVGPRATIPPIRRWLRARRLSLGPMCGATRRDHAHSAAHTAADSCAWADSWRRSQRPRTGPRIRRLRGRQARGRTQLCRGRLVDDDPEPRVPPEVGGGTVRPLGRLQRASQDRRLPLPRDEQPAFARLEEPGEPDRDPRRGHGRSAVSLDRSLPSRPLGPPRRTTRSHPSKLDNRFEPGLLVHSSASSTRRCVRSGRPTR